MKDKAVITEKALDESVVQQYPDSVHEVHSQPSTTVCTARPSHLLHLPLASRPDEKLVKNVNLTPSCSGDGSELPRQHRRSAFGSLRRRPTSEPVRPLRK
eukprot:1181537-Prorocentrum_minimum.AAC.5